MSSDVRFIVRYQMSDMKRWTMLSEIHVPEMGEKIQWTGVTASVTARWPRESGTEGCCKCLKRLLPHRRATRPFTYLSDIITAGIGWLGGYGARSCGGGHGIHMVMAIRQAIWTEMLNHHQEATRLETIIRGTLHSLPSFLPTYVPFQLAPIFLICQTYTVPPAFHRPYFPA